MLYCIQSRCSIRKECLLVIGDRPISALRFLATRSETRLPTCRTRVPFSSGSRLCPLCTSVLFDSPTKRGAPEHNKCAMEQFKAGIIEVSLDDIVKSRCATSANIPYECPEFQGPGIFNNHCASRQWRLPKFSISRSFLSCASLFVMEPLRVGAARRPYSAARREAKSNLFNLHTDVASAHAPVCSSIRSQMEQLGMISKGAWQFDP